MGGCALNRLCYGVDMCYLRRPLDDGAEAVVETAPAGLLPGGDCYAAANFNEKVVLIAITNYGVRCVQDARFQWHFSLFKTIEAAFGLPYLGHAKDATTNTLAPLLTPSQNRQ